jgi:hypothetical protein
MSKNKAILIIGVIILILPDLGFPPEWDSIFYVLLGLVLVLISIWNSIEARSGLRLFKKNKPQSSDTPFVDGQASATASESVSPSDHTEPSA